MFFVVLYNNNKVKEGRTISLLLLILLLSLLSKIFASHEKKYMLLERVYSMIEKKLIFLLFLLPYLIIIKEFMVPK